MPKHFLFFFIGSLFLTLTFSHAASYERDLLGSYEFKDPYKGRFFVTLEENNMVFRHYASGAEEAVNGTWDLKNSILSISCEIDSEPLELGINFADVTLDHLKKGIFVKSSYRTLKEEKSLTFWVKKTE